MPEIVCRAQFFGFTAEKTFAVSSEKRKREKRVVISHRGWSVIACAVKSYKRSNKGLVRGDEQVKIELLFKCQVEREHCLDKMFRGFPRRDACSNERKKQSQDRSR